MGLLGGRRRRSTLTGAEADEVAGRFRDGHDLERQMSPDSSLNLTDSPSTSFRRELDHELDDPLDTNDPKSRGGKSLFGFMRKNNARDANRDANRDSTGSSKESSTRESNRDSRDTTSTGGHVSHGHGPSHHQIIPTYGYSLRHAQSRGDDDHQHKFYASPSRSASGRAGAASVDSHEEEPYFAGPSRSAAGRQAPSRPHSIKSGKSVKLEKAKKAKEPKPPKVPKAPKPDYMSLGMGIGGDVAGSSNGDVPMIGMGIGGDVCAHRIPVAPTPSLSASRSRGLLSSTSSAGSSPSLASQPTTTSPSLTSPTRERGFSLLTVASSTDAHGGNGAQAESSSSAPVIPPVDASASGANNRTMSYGSDIITSFAAEAHFGMSSSTLGDLSQPPGSAYRQDSIPPSLAPLSTHHSRTSYATSQATSHDDNSALGLNGYGEYLTPDERKKKEKKDQKEKKAAEKRAKKERQLAERRERIRIQNEQEAALRARVGNGMGLTGMASMASGMAAWSFAMPPPSGFASPQMTKERQEFLRKKREEQAKLEAAKEAANEQEAKEQPQDAPAAEAPAPVPSPAPVSAPTSPPAPQSPSSPRAAPVELARPPVVPPTQRTFSLVRRPRRRASGGDAVPGDPEFDGPMVVISAEPRTETVLEEREESVELERQGSYVAKLRTPADENSHRRRPDRGNRSDRSDTEGELSPSLSRPPVSANRRPSNASAASRYSRFHLDDDVLTFMHVLEASESHTEDVDEILSRHMPPTVDQPLTRRESMARRRESVVSRESAASRESSTTYDVAIRRRESATSRDSVLTFPAPPTTQPLSIAKRRRDLAMSPMRVEMPAVPRFPTPPTHGPAPASTSVPTTPNNEQNFYSPSSYTRQSLTENMSQSGSPRAAQRNSVYSNTLSSPRTPHSPQQNGYSGGHSPHSPHPPALSRLPHSSHSVHSPSNTQGSYFPASSQSSYHTPAAVGSLFIATGQALEDAHSRTSSHTSEAAYALAPLPPVLGESPAALSAAPLPPPTAPLPPVPPPSAPLPPLPPNARPIGRSPRSPAVATAVSGGSPVSATASPLRRPSAASVAPPRPVDTTPLPESPTIPVHEYEPETLIDFSRAPDVQSVSDVADDESTTMAEDERTHTVQDPSKAYVPERKPLRNHGLDPIAISRSISRDPLNMHGEVHEPAPTPYERGGTPLSRRYSRPLSDCSPTLPRDRPLSDISPTLPFSPMLPGHDLAYLDEDDEDEEDDDSTVSEASSEEELYDIPSGMREVLAMSDKSGSSTPSTLDAERSTPVGMSPMSESTDTCEVVTPPTDGDVFEFPALAAFPTDSIVDMKPPVLPETEPIPAIDIDSALSTPSTAMFPHSDEGHSVESAVVSTAVSTLPARAQATSVASTSLRPPTPRAAPTATLPAPPPAVPLTRSPSRSIQDKAAALGFGIRPVGPQSRATATPPPQAPKQQQTPQQTTSPASRPSRSPRAPSPAPSTSTRDSSPSRYTRRSSSSTRSRRSSARAPSPEPTLDEFMATFRNMKNRGGMSIREAVRRAEAGTGFGH